MTDPVVELQSGSVRGAVVKHPEGFNYYAFKGIPYGEPPIDELRFQDPLPVKGWSGVKDCKNYGPSCLQYDPFTKHSSLSEDCLHLNVFTHSINDENSRKPVVAIIHGGGMYFGSADDLWYGPDYMIRKNLVLVLMNYRLGVLGFLNLEDEIAPGNQGLKDQVLALQWIQQNIGMFGGDPDNVTVFGVGTGGHATQMLALSPLTKGLMHKVISGSILMNSPWLRIKNPKSNAIKFCALMGKDLQDPKEILDFLKNADCKTLQEAQERFRHAMDALAFGPGMDSKSPNPLMPSDPDAAADQAVHLPYLIGYAAREGNALLIEDIYHAGSSISEFLASCNLDFKKIFQYNTRDIMKRYNLTEMQVKRLYFKSKTISDDDLNEYIEFVNDFYFIEAIHKFARTQAEKSSASTYLFVFSYDSPNSLVKSLLANAPPGASHLDELPYLFKMRALEKTEIGNLRKGTEGYKMMEGMTDMLANFAKHGRPTIEKSELTPIHWLPVTDGTALRYLNIDEDLTMQLTVNVDQKLLSAKDIKV